MEDLIRAVLTLVVMAAGLFLVFVLPVVVGCWLLWAGIRWLNRR